VIVGVSVVLHHDGEIEPLRRPAQAERGLQIIGSVERGPRLGNEVVQAKPTRVAPVLDVTVDSQLPIAYRDRTELSHGRASP
jgi:hypothetical protein